MIFVSRECFLRFRRIAVSFLLAKHVLAELYLWRPLTEKFLRQSFSCLLRTEPLGVSAWKLAYFQCVFNLILLAFSRVFFQDYFKLSLNNCCLCHCLSVLVPPVSSTDFSCYRPCGDLRSLLPEVTCLPLPVCVCTQTSGVVVAERSQLAAACSGVCEGVSCWFPRLRDWLTGPWLIAAEVVLRSGLPGP